MTANLERAVRTVRVIYRRAVDKRDDVLAQQLAAVDRELQRAFPSLDLDGPDLDTATRQLRGWRSQLNQRAKELAVRERKLRERERRVEQGEQPDYDRLRARIERDIRRELTPVIRQQVEEERLAAREPEAEQPDEPIILCQGQGITRGIL